MLTELFLAIDPGSIHNGVACFENEECVWAKEFTQEQLFKRLEETKVKLVVFENFVLYPSKSKEQQWSELETVQVIGVIKYICKRRGIAMIKQGANIKVPIAAQLRARKVALKSRGKGQHATDAEWQGFYAIAKNKTKEGSENNKTEGKLLR